jgi:RNA polymerase sigma-54 factor
MFAGKPLALQETRAQATAHLARTMAYLQLNSAELEATLLKEVDRNPALELVDEVRCPSCGRRLDRPPCPTCAAPRGDGSPVVFLSPREPGRDWRGVREGSEAPEPGMAERLDEYVLRQVGPSLTRAERPIAAYILAQIDEGGLLAEAPVEIAQFKRVPLSMVERVLALIQRADPVGVGARTPQEALLIQLDALEEAGRADAATAALARALIREHFEALGKMEYDRIARRLRAEHGWHLRPEAIARAAHFIHVNLTPYPACAAWGEGKHPTRDDAGVFHLADVNISTLDPQMGGGLAVEVFTPLAGWLRVNPDLKAAVAECAGEERERWAQAVAEAALVTKCLQQRNHTMRRLMEILATEQRQFILGSDADLRPTTRCRIAAALGLHESTVSRAVAGKSVALPGGRIIPLSRFFDRSLSVRDRVRSLIEAEAAQGRALTDDEIAAALAREGVMVARRTVAKYRNMLGILPANLRGRRARARSLTSPPDGAPAAAALQPA